MCTQHCTRAAEIGTCITTFCSSPFLDFLPRGSDVGNNTTNNSKKAAYTFRPPKTLFDAVVGWDAGGSKSAIVVMPDPCQGASSSSSSDISARWKALEPVLVSWIVILACRHRAEGRRLLESCRVGSFHIFFSPLSPLMKGTSNAQCFTMFYRF